MTIENDLQDSSFDGTDYRGYLVSVRLVREGAAIYRPKRISSSKDIYDFLRSLEDFDREVLYAVHLDVRCQVVGCEQVSKGTVCSSQIHPREAFKSAILANASSLVVCHNHPSGDPTPSREDEAATERLRFAGEVLGITVADHVIVGRSCHYSMAEGKRYG